MTVNLIKGQKIDLTKGNAGLNQIMVGLGWDPVSNDPVPANQGLLKAIFGGGRKNFDCDSAVIMVDADNKLKNHKDVVYFANLTHSSRSVAHRGDNLTGDGAGDDEQIFVELKSVPAHIERLIFVVNIFNCIKRGQDFGMIQNAYIRIVDNQSQKELVRFNLTDSYKGYTALEVGEVYRHNGEWKFAATGNGTKDASLRSMLEKYV